MPKSTFEKTLAQWYAFERAAKRAERDYRSEVESCKYYENRYEQFLSDYRTASDSGEEYNRHAWGELLEKEKNILREARRSLAAAKAEAEKSRRRANIWKEALQSVSNF